MAVTSISSGADNNLKVEPQIVIKLTDECLFFINACITVAKPFKTAKVLFFTWINSMHLNRIQRDPSNFFYRCRIH